MTILRTTYSGTYVSHIHVQNAKGCIIENNLLSVEDLGSSSTAAMVLIIPQK
jgi:hypothetical protein